MLEDAQSLVQNVQELATVYGLKVVAAIVIFVVGRIVAKWAGGLVQRLLERGSADPIIVGFVRSITYVALMVFVGLAALGQLGIQTTSFIAILGAAGLAIGLAFQSSLSNFAAGFLMIMFRPFKVGDFIEGAGVAGVVESIQIFTTTMRTGDNKTIIIPNSKLSGDNIINYSAKETRRVDLTVGVSYDAQLPHVREVLNAIIAADERVLDDPEPLIAVAELADNSVNFVVRVWVNSGDYWGTFFDMNETIKMRFDEEGIGIPYPQRDIHLYEHKAES